MRCCWVGSGAAGSDGLARLDENEFIVSSGNSFVPGVPLISKRVACECAVGRRPNGLLGLSVPTAYYYCIRQSQSDKTVLALGRSPGTSFRISNELVPLRPPAPARARPSPLPSCSASFIIQTRSLGFRHSSPPHRAAVKKVDFNWKFQRQKCLQINVTHMIYWHANAIGADVRCVE